MLQRITHLLVLLVLLTRLPAQPVIFTISAGKKAQTIENIGASGAWFSEGIGKYWPDTTREQMAELLFSKAFDKEGKPKGIGLSAWRFNIGGGTAEQGDSSGISNPVKRVESFLSPDGRYDWSKQQGYLWFVKKAKQYGVENLIAFSNTPPVQFTKNGLGFKTEKDYQTNLREDSYGAYAGFLATVARHFDEQGLHLQYISPVNEPQWDWSGKKGQMNQEGSPWHNTAIHRIAVSLDSALRAQRLTTQFFIPEAATLTALYEGKDHASHQIQHFFDPGSPLYVGRLQRLKKVAAGHSYFTDNGDTTIAAVRTRVKDTAARYHVPYWQTEYSMLANGYKEGKPGPVAAIDCALFLAKIIHADLAIGHAAAWHLWNAWEPGSAGWNTRYYLLALHNNAANMEGTFTITKNLWALGHYSRFIRPGMQRLLVQRSDTLNHIQAAQNVMLSAYAGGRQMVVVAINYTSQQQIVQLKLPGWGNPRRKVQYITTAAANDNMKPCQLASLSNVVLPARSISTIVLAAP